MKIVYAFLALFLIGVASMLNLLWLTALFAIVFTYYFGASWLLVIAILLDGYFNAFTTIPVFSLVALGWYIFSELARSRMRV